MNVCEQEDEIHASVGDECENEDNDYYDKEDVDEDIDRLDEMLQGDESEYGKQPHEFEFLSEAAKTLLYPSCTKFTKLNDTLTLNNIKSVGNRTDISFDNLLDALQGMFPDEIAIPKSYYYAKKLMCPFVLEYKKIHDCPNACVLHRNKYANLDECPRCGKSFLARNK